MKNKEFFIKIENFDYNTGKFSGQIDFISSYALEDMQEIFNEKKILKWSVKVLNKIPKTYEQLKKIHNLYQKILKFFEIPYTKNNENALDTQLKRTLLKCDSVVIAGESIPLLPSKEKMDIEEASQYIEAIINLYGKKIKDLNE